MAKNTNTQRKPRQRRKFLAVDVWQTQFGPVSETAIYDVYSTKFKVEQHNMKNYTFSHCVNALRKLEDPDYVAPVNSSSR